MPLCSNALGPSPISSWRTRRTFEPPRFLWFPTRHSAHESLPFLCHTRSLFSVPGMRPIWTNVCFTFPNARCHPALGHWNIFVPPAQLGSPSICPGGGKMVNPVIRTWIVWTIRQFHKMLPFSLSLICDIPLPGLGHPFPAETSKPPRILWSQNVFGKLGSKSNST